MNYVIVFTVAAAVSMAWDKRGGEPPSISMAVASGTGATIGYWAANKYL